jgi:hypothetical protein
MIGPYCLSKLKGEQEALRLADSGAVPLTILHLDVRPIERVKWSTIQLHLNPHLLNSIFYAGGCLGMVNGFPRIEQVFPSYRKSRQRNVTGGCFTKKSVSGK